jgi:hypothetical protein
MVISIGEGPNSYIESSRSLVETGTFLFDEIPIGYTGK